MKLKLPFRIASIVSLIILAEGAWAEGGSFVPAAAMPETVSHALRTEQRQTKQQAVLPALAPPKPKPSALAEQAKKIKFKLNGIVLEGNHIYTEEQLKPVYINQVSKTISVSDLFEIVQALTVYYRNNGYIISRAILPPQHVKNGIVHIKIIEGYIGQVSVSGNPKGAKCLVLAFGNKIKACPPLEISRMEKYLLLANDIPGTTVKAVLSPSKTETGAADLIMVTDNRPIMGYLSYDDYGTRYIGPQQMTANIELNSFVTSGDAAQATFTKTAQGGELTYMDVNYNFAVDAEGKRFLYGATRAHTHPLFVLRRVQIDGINSNYYSMLQIPWIRTRTKSLTFRAGFNYLDSDVTSLDLPLYTDHIRSLDVGGTYNFSDKWYGANQISGDFRQGLPILGYTSDTQKNAQTSRPGGHAKYSKIALTASRLQAVKGPVSVYGLVTGQWAFNALLASEQFTYGGSVLGRGYDVAELIGDQGLAGTIELRYDLAMGRILQSLQLYTFYDWGVIWNRLNLPGQPRKLSGTTAGVGTRFYFSKYITGNIMWTQGLTKQVAAYELIHEGKRSRVFFSIVASFG